MIRLKCDSSSRNVENVLKKSVIMDGFEKLSRVPVNHRSYRSLRKERKKKRLKTKGDEWYNLPATKITPEVRRDLEVLRMRSVADPKRFYKKNDFKELPKYFQIGRVQETPADFYSGRVPKRERRRTIVEEMLIDEDFKKFTERKYKEILQSDPKRRKKAQRQARKLKKLRK